MVRDIKYICMCIRVYVYLIMHNGVRQYLQPTFISENFLYIAGSFVTSIQLQSQCDEGRKLSCSWWSCDVLIRSVAMVLFNSPYIIIIISGVRLSLLVLRSLLAYVPTPDDRWWWLRRNWWNEDWQGKPKYSEKTYPNATLSTTNPTWLDPGSNPGRRGGKPVTNRLSYGAALFIFRLSKIMPFWRRKGGWPWIIK
jgi:hypothetical protein